MGEKTTHRPAPARITIALVTASLLALTGCTAAAEPEPAPTESTVAPVTDTSTLRTMIDSPAEDPQLTIGEPVDALASETAVEVFYPSGGITVAGVVRTPTDATEDSPVIVVVHGGVEPEEYEPGTDLVAEQRALLSSGYIVFALDLRGFGDSDPANAETSATVDPGFGWDVVLDWGMALDVVNGLRLARDGQIPLADPERVGLLGHSLGGLLAMDAAVIAPGLSDMVVAMSAPTSNLAEAGTRFADEDLLAEVGSPEDNPEYWADISPRTFFDRVTEPLVLIHGGDDDVTLPEWSEDTRHEWRKAGGSAEAYIVDGAGHDFGSRRSEVAGGVVVTFDAALQPGG